MHVCLCGWSCSYLGFICVYTLENANKRAHTHLKLLLLLTFALLEVRMHKLRCRVLCWRHTRYLIIISQTITGLIVIGEILERGEEKCQVYWQGIFILWLVFLSLHFRSVDLVPHLFQFLKHREQHKHKLPKRQTQTHICTSPPLGWAYLWLFSKGKKKRTERPLKGQREWQGLLSISIVFYKKRSGSKLWDW